MLANVAGTGGERCRGWSALSATLSQQSVPAARSERERGRERKDARLHRFQLTLWGWTGGLADCSDALSSGSEALQLRATQRRRGDTRRSSSPLTSRVRSTVASTGPSSASTARLRVRGPFLADPLLQPHRHSNRTRGLARIGFAPSSPPSSTPSWSSRAQSSPHRYTRWLPSHPPAPTSRTRVRPHRRRRPSPSATSRRSSRALARSR